MKKLTVLAAAASVLLATGCSDAEKPTFTCENPSYMMKCLAKVPQNIDEVEAVTRVILEKSIKDQVSLGIAPGDEYLVNVTILYGFDRQPSNTDFDMRASWKTGPKRTEIQAAIDSDQEMAALNVSHVSGIDIINFSSWLELHCLAGRRKMHFCRNTAGVSID